MNNQFFKYLLIAISIAFVTACGGGGGGTDSGGGATTPTTESSTPSPDPVVATTPPTASAEPAPVSTVDGVYRGSVSGAFSVNGQSSPESFFINIRIRGNSVEISIGGDLGTGRRSGNSISGNVPLVGSTGGISCRGNIGVSGAISGDVIRGSVSGSVPCTFQGQTVSVSYSGSYAARKS